MKLEVYEELEEIRVKLNAQQKSISIENKKLGEEFTIELRKQVDELLFGSSCCECNRMAAIPQGAFAVLQVRKNLNRTTYPAKLYEEEKDRKENKNNTGFSSKVLQEGRELTPLKYNSKLMNSIWGLYNRYSVHNFKQIDANEVGLLAWGHYNPTEATTTGSVISAGH